MTTPVGIPLLVIAGPTAAGKTELALRLAEAHGGEVVSADSMQIYRRLEVGTAKPTPEERARAPIHLIDFVEPDEPYSVAQYQRDARKAIADIAGRQHIEFAAQPSGAAAVIGNRDDGGDVQGG